MKRFLTPLVLLAGIALATGGCHDMGAVVVTGLRVELNSIERHADGTAAANLHVVNPNVATYLVAAISGRVYLNGALAGTFDLREPLGIPQQDSADKTVPLALAGTGGQALANAAGQDPVSYRVDATMFIQIYGDQRERGDVTHSGTVPVVAK
jgi:hypothetical protein